MLPKRYCGSKLNSRVAPESNKCALCMMGVCVSVTIAHIRSRRKVNGV